MHELSPQQPGSATPAAAIVAAVTASRPLDVSVVFVGR